LEHRSVEEPGALYRSGSAAIGFQTLKGSKTLLTQNLPEIGPLTLTIFTPRVSRRRDDGDEIGFGAGDEIADDVFEYWKRGLEAFDGKGRGRLDSGGEAHRDVHESRVREVMVVYIPRFIYMFINTFINTFLM
jgi:hypothetical protein